ncbi:MAG TPA: translation initiation factor IF-2, partial [Dehalococcoidia bacterium]|nr:translation initiation factor IF-2 [Dehalococcoidia bacterium]
VMPQTIEAINHVRAAEVPMIIAINKSDLPAANPDRVKQQLTEQSVVVEDYGGDVLAVPVSATTGAGLDDLLESIDLVAEIQELKASTDSLATGTVVEAELDSRRGPVATVLIANGTLRQGDALVSGLISGKVKAMFDERGDRLSEAGPSRPVRIMGLEDVPAAGDAIEVIESERSARRIVEEARREAESS